MCSVSCDVANTHRFRFDELKDWAVIDQAEARRSMKGALIVCENGQAIGTGLGER